MHSIQHCVERIVSAHGTLHGGLYSFAKLLGAGNLFLRVIQATDNVFEARSGFVMYSVLPLTSALVGVASLRKRWPRSHGGLCGRRGALEREARALGLDSADR